MKYVGIIIAVAVGLVVVIIIRKVVGSKGDLFDDAPLFLWGSLGLISILVGAIALLNDRAWDDEEGWLVLVGLACIGTAVRAISKSR